MLHLLYTRLLVRGSGLYGASSGWSEDLVCMVRTALEIDIAFLATFLKFLVIFVTLPLTKSVHWSRQ